MKQTLLPFGTNLGCQVECTAEIGMPQRLAKCCGLEIHNGNWQ